MLLPRQLPRLLQEWDESEGSLSAAASSPARDAWRPVAGALSGLLSFGLALSAVAVALMLDARLAVVFAPALLLALVLVHDLWRPRPRSRRDGLALEANRAV